MESVLHEPRKSWTTEFLSGLCRELLVDIGWDTSSANRLRDAHEVVLRASSRGLGFFNSDLPSLGKSLLSALETGHFIRPPAFRGRRKSSSIPAFLQGHFKRLFDDEGILQPDFEPYLVQEVLQVCFLAYKMDLPFAPHKEQKVIDNFVAVEEELPPVESCIVKDSVLNYAASLLDRLFSDFDPKDIRPKHGPGAVATGEKYLQKFNFKRKYANIHQYYPYYDYFVVNKGPEILDRLTWYKSLTLEPYGLAKVILVPKDARGPRLISEEPLEYQWIQQGLSASMVRLIETHQLTSGFVNFTDQSINQNLAREGSISGAFATLDLKDASDRVSCSLVETLFPEKVKRALFASRSGWTCLPDNRKFELKKFAPMGSALCFPVMALTLWSITQAIIHESSETVHGAERRCYVYGDDLVVPTDVAQRVLAYLPRVYLCANEDKSFYRGSFRESCGGDFYKGVRVTPLRAKSPWTANREDSRAYSSYIAMANAFYGRGFWSTSGWLLDQVRAIYGRIPYGTATSSYPCITLDSPIICTMLNMGVRHEDIDPRFSTLECLEFLSNLNQKVKPFRFRFNESLQVAQFKVRTICNAGVRDPITGWSRLLFDLTCNGSSDRSIKDHHLYDDGLFGSFDYDPDAIFDQVVPRSTLIKREWRSVS